jgi:hypothetical protein
MSETTTTAVVDRRITSSALLGRLAMLVRARRSQAELVLAATLYLGFACFMTWPLITNLAHSIYGGPGDPYGAITFYRALVAHHHNPFLPGTISQLAAPEGQPIPWPRDLASAPGVLAIYVLTVPFGAIPAYALYTLLGYTLTGAVTFLFVRRLTANTWAALIAGWAYAFYPFAIINGQGHLDFVHGWVLVLAVWRMLELMWSPSRRNGLLAGAAVVLAMWWSPYFILFCGVAYVVATGVSLFVAWRDGNLRAALAPQLIAAVMIVAFAGFLGALSTAGGEQGIGIRQSSLQTLAFYAARPLQYLLPDARSPLFGGFTHHYIATHQGVDSVEHTLYVGITLILLALVALGAFARRRLPPRLGRAVLVLALVALAAAITSMPPETRIFGVLVPFPSHFISQVTTTWRVYSRFVVIVMLGLSVLAAVGLDVLTRRRGLWVKIAVMSLATVAVPLDLWARLDGHVYKVSTPAVYRTLARQPMGLVAEYPLGPGNGGNNYTDIFYEHVYNKPMINGYGESSFQERRAFSLANLADPATAPRLATLGVRYVIVDAAPPTLGWSPPYSKPGAGFHLIAHEPYADLYLVTARPSSPALAAAGEGFTATEPTETGSANWLTASSGTIELAGACTSCNGVLSLTLVSFSQPHQAAILDSHGHVLAHGSVEGSTRVSIPLRFSKRATLRLIATPGPQPVSEAPGSPSVSLQMSKLQFEALSTGDHGIARRAAKAR